MINRILIVFLSAQVLLASSVSLASPWGLPSNLSDQNMKISFDVHAPLNILDGTAEEVSGKLSLADNLNPESLLADIAVQKIDYRAGLSPGGRLVSVWLRANPPTPGRFVISKTSLGCTPESITSQAPCKGSVDGRLTIWGKDYTIDVPIEMKKVDKGYVLNGFKKIKFGEYGFGDPTSTIAKLKPTIDLNFSITLP